MTESGQNTRKRPTGRRTGDSGTRDAILDAARDLFADLGFDGASIRAIAAAAGVDPALIRHFFGDKETLFASTVADRTAIPQRLVDALTGDPAQLGRRVTDTYLKLWEDPETQPVLQALVRSATTSDRAAAMLREVLGARLLSQEILPGFDEDRIRRLAICASHLLGIAVARYIIKLPAISALPRDALMDEVAPTIQRYLTGQHQ
ncbi:TetR/AcrR family transcriptional regulator [Arthrobacter sp. 9AX]|uniref:TetR/AcrR family transcriptional regulator n=1 Tax=Arthrobacter sp. 9AX TaxID=2653131 RepID=UPI0012F12252|nr:TetR family transcriptional regulator [Arthrobacter sp. 9AX]VXB05627.1 TetR/AcrR family transcriptional regulator [Arthrobacter sp. 9AX]